MRVGVFTALLSQLPWLRLSRNSRRSISIPSNSAREIIRATRTASCRCSKMVRRWPNFRKFWPITAWASAP
jgi:hypothetical protein